MTRHPFRVGRIAFANGSTVDATDFDILVIVGPNNVGKSRTLQEIVGRVARDETGDQFRVADVEIAHLADRATTEDWLSTHWVRDEIKEATATYSGFRAPNGQFFHDSWLGDWTTNAQSLPGPLKGLVTELPVSTRLQPPTSGGWLDPRRIPNELVHQFYDPATLDRFSNLMFDAFGFHVAFDGWPGNAVLKKSPERYRAQEQSARYGRPTEDEIEYLQSLEPLTHVGDGVLAFLTIYLTLSSGRFVVSILDEPELHLHPPQAERLAKALADFRNGGQLLIATHSADILRGLLDNPTARVGVIRIDGLGPDFRVHVIEPGVLRDLWRTPALRYSGALEAIFSSRAVVCEGPVDARYYSRVSERLNRPPTETVRFVDAGGKQNVGRTLSSLRAMGVPAAAVVDFDLLLTEGVLRRTLEALGSPADLRESAIAESRSIQSLIAGGAPDHTVATMKTEIALAFEDVADEQFVDDQMIRTLRGILSTSSLRERLKSTGLAAVPDSLRIATILDRLEEEGLILLRTGALESLEPNIETGRSWLSDAIVSTREPSAEARAVVTRALDFNR
jgi:hypothetical protein